MKTLEKTPSHKPARGFNPEAGRFHACRGRSGPRRKWFLWTIAMAVFLTGMCAHAQKEFYWHNFAGLPGQGGSTDGTGSAARFLFPVGVAVDGNGNLYVSDNATIRKVTPGAEVTTLAGTPGIEGDADGTGSAARFSAPEGVAVDGSGNVYVADYKNRTIRKVTAGGVVTTLAGSPGVSGSTDGTGSAAQFNYPQGVAVDGGGNVFVADTQNYTIRKVTPDGVVTTIAGSPGAWGSADGTGSAARFSNPIAVAVDWNGNLFVADFSTIRKITPDGVVMTLAGSPAVIGSADGTGSAARFSNPEGVAVDGGGNVFVADAGNCTVRKVTADGVVTTIGGTPGASGYADGLGSEARFSFLSGVAVSSYGVLFIADPLNSRISKGVFTSLAANDDRGFTYGASNVVIPVLLNDEAVSGGSLTIVSVTQGSFGSVTANPDGTITYKPSKNYDGRDAFTYTIIDALGDTAIGSVTVENGLAISAGSYAGLITNGTPTNDNSGYFSAALTNTGAFSGKLFLAGIGYGVKGHFDRNLKCLLSIDHPDRKPLQEPDALLQLDPGALQITGTVFNRKFTSTLTAERVPFDAKSNPAPQTGRYTLLLPPDPSTLGSPLYPQGIGYLSLAVAPDGSVATSGKLGDGTPVCMGGWLATGSSFPFYAGLYGDKHSERGSIFGNVAIPKIRSPHEPVSGTFAWFKPAQTGDHDFYRKGFATTIRLLGAPYVAPEPGVPALFLPDGKGQVILAGGNLAAPITRSFILSTDNQVTFTDPPPRDTVKLELSIFPSTGLFSGSFYDTACRNLVKRTFTGVLIQNQAIGGGTFLGWTESGSIELGAAPKPPL